MERRSVWMGVMAVSLTLAVGLRVTAQQPAQPPAGQAPSRPPAGQAEQPAHGGPEAPQPPAPAPRPQGGPGGGFQPAPRFPAHQRPPVPPEVLERGKAQYAALCSPCHGGDARGGQLGGVNLLRSQLVLDDKDGELIIPVVKNGRPGPPPMPPLPMADEDIKAVAAYLHSLQAQGSNQGGPPAGETVELNILVGDAKAGAAFFASTCSTCHSASGDLQGIATRAGDPRGLQNLWVSGGRAAPRGAGRRGGGPPPGKPLTATVTLPSGEVVSGRLLRLDDFSVTVGFEDGLTRTIRRTGADVPRIAVQDPLAKHRELLGVLTNTQMHDVTAYLATLK